MSQEQRTTLEVIAPTVEEAIQKGLEQLNLTEDAVDVEVLDSGSRGLFGIGSRQARVRLIVKGEQPTATTPASIIEEDVPNHEEIIWVSEKVVSDLLERMRIKARVKASIRPSASKDEEETVLVNIEGDDLSILIGRRSETLNALQYIASLIVGRRLNRWIPMIIDVQGYRQRRERQLRMLARRMADQAVHTGRRQVLEPMPPNERRVIHLELRDHPLVITESIGEDPHRKVTITPKRH
jgi:spoIIIJ-associated protein